MTGDDARLDDATAAAPGRPDPVAADVSPTPGPPAPDTGPESGPAAEPPQLVAADARTSVEGSGESDVAPPPPGHPYPPGVYPAVYAPPDAPAPEAEPAGKRRRGIVVVALGAVAFLVVKFIVPILFATAVGGVLTGVFGGPFEKLPSDQKRALETRIDASTGEAFKGLSEVEQSSRIDAMYRSGLPRLTDELLVEKVHLTVTMLNAADVATCARVARATATGVNDRPALEAALNAMSGEAVGRWFEISVSAIEAGANGSPPERTVVQADSDRVLAALGATLSDTEGRQVRALYDGSQASDDDACGAVRAIYMHMEELPAADLSIAALADVAP
jgi:hypothetical protein